eukprot:CAMPEP_0197853722 /NCGR_PEP_ID=MMETSP1438-20131217/23282_1 /TAXON_ID=1461541 /ORGANISM="Pterosperma sp., Strain CCMP1384" /LENGTH=36 /DNA_ID= /DNA_START= /DNA_END= /DNA_ORIENTATION=
MKDPGGTLRAAGALPPGVNGLNSSVGPLAPSLTSFK